MRTTPSEDALITAAMPAIGMVSGRADDPRLARVRMRGVDVTMAYVPDDAEHRRSAATGLGAVTRLDLLDALFGLPSGSVVPWGSLSPGEHRAVRRLPPGCVDLTPAGVVRLLRRPLRAELAVVHAASWRTGLDRAGRFGAYCARMVVLPEIPADVDRARIEADYWGTGLAVAGHGEVIVPPEPFRERAHTPAGWAFAEDLYRRAVLATVGAGSSPAQTHRATGGTKTGSRDRTSVL